MDHKLSISGNFFRLRPVSLEDAAFIVEVRTDPLRNRFINPTSLEVEKQEQWLKRYFEAPDDYYFIIENEATGEREGTVGIYRLDVEAKRAEWGRWVVRRGSKSAIPSLLLSFKLAFEQIGLDSF
ncbi:MAG: GNAT family N-acetyltransferase [Bryobacteraceae bacterium]